jgi:hypothetical protein
MTREEQLKELEALGDKIDKLDDYINSLDSEHWGNGYADSIQRDYDFLLNEYNEKRSQYESNN